MELIKQKSFKVIIMHFLREQKLFFIDKVVQQLGYCLNYQRFCNCRITLKLLTSTLSTN